MTRASSTSPSASAAPSGSIRIERRRPEDAPALERMYAEVFGEEAARRNRARWRWQYEENPHCPDEGPEIWVAKQDGRILGQYATMPVRLKVRDRLLRASWGMDVMVGPGLQRKGIGSRLFLYWDRQVEASLGLGLSRASYTLFRKLRWEDVGPVPCYTRILDAGPLLRRRVGRAAVVLAPAARLFLGLALPARPTRRRGEAPPVRVEPFEGPFDERFDALWESASAGFDFIAERRAAYLEWKYRRIPYVRYDVLAAFRADALTGYAVVRTTERGGVRLGLLVDWLADPEDTETLDALLDAVAAWGRDHAVARLQTFTFDRRLGRRLLRKGFVRIASPMQFCLRIHADDVDEAFFRDTSRWHVTFGDSDQDRDP